MEAPGGHLPLESSWGGTGARRLRRGQGLTAYLALRIVRAPICVPISLSPGKEGQPRLQSESLTWSLLAGALVLAWMGCDGLPQVIWLILGNRVQFSAVAPFSVVPSGAATTYASSVVGVVLSWHWARIHGLEGSVKMWSTSALPGPPQSLFWAPCCWWSWAAI